MNRKTFLASLLSFSVLPQKMEETKEKNYQNGVCPVCDTAVSNWLNEQRCNALYSGAIIKPQYDDCASNEVTGSRVYQQHVCQKCKTIFAYNPTSPMRR
jgi:hypothetical protein